MLNKIHLTINTAARLQPLCFVFYRGTEIDRSFMKPRKTASKHLLAK